MLSQKSKSILDKKTISQEDSNPYNMTIHEAEKVKQRNSDLISNFKIDDHEINMNSSLEDVGTREMHHTNISLSSKPDQSANPELIEDFAYNPQQNTKKTFQL